MKKIICNCCGKAKAPFEYYNRPDGFINKICKECKKTQAAERYRKKRPCTKTYHKRGELMSPLDGEEWREVIYKGKTFFVSNIGRVAYTRNDKHLYLYTLKIDDNGYVRISPKNTFVHRLVVTAFISEVPQNMVINHKNGMKTDNRVENLEIITQQENVLHAINVLGKVHLGLKGRFGKCHPMSKPVLCYDKNGAFVKRYESLCEASRETNLGLANISSVCCGRPHCKTCGGYIWRFE